MNNNDITCILYILLLQKASKHYVIYYYIYNLFIVKLIQYKYMNGIIYVLYSRVYTRPHLSLIELIPYIIFSKSIKFYV